MEAFICATLQIDLCETTWGLQGLQWEETGPGSATSRRRYDSEKAAATFLVLFLIDCVTKGQHQPPGFWVDGKKQQQTNKTNKQKTKKAENPECSFSSLFSLPGNIAGNQGQHMLESDSSLDYLGWKLSCVQGRRHD